jgi:uncharacterized repeat protein (TIGR02543 family)
VVLGYSFTYYANTGSGTPPTGYTQTLKPGDNITVAAATGLSKTGYQFSRWNTQSNGNGLADFYDPGDPLTMGTADVTLYAIWTANTYTVTFDEQEGMPTGQTKTVTYDGTYGTLATVTYAGHTFEGLANRAPRAGDRSHCRDYGDRHVRPYPVHVMGLQRMDAIIGGLWLLHYHRS